MDFFKVNFWIMYIGEIYLIGIVILNCMQRNVIFSFSKRIGSTL